MLHQKIAFAFISWLKSVALLWESSLYHRFLSTTVFQHNQSPSLHLIFWLLSCYHMSPLKQKRTFRLLYQSHAQLYLGVKGRPALLVWRKGEKPGWTLMTYGAFAYFPRCWPQMPVLRYSMGSNPLWLNKLKKPKIYYQRVLYKS